MPVNLVNKPIPHNDPNGTPCYYITNGNTAISVTVEDMNNLYGEIAAVVVKYENMDEKRIKRMAENYTLRRSGPAIRGSL